MELMEQWTDMIVSGRRADQPSSITHHRLEPLHKVHEGMPARVASPIP